MGLSPDRIKALLEEKALAGESNFGLFRSARQSESPTEEFLHLYQIILMLCGDEQRDVDAWIKGQDAAVPQTPTGLRGRRETVYTRLRNEFGHKRDGVNLDDTKKEMASRLGGLRELARLAIRNLT